MSDILSPEQVEHLKKLGIKNIQNYKEITLPDMIKKVIPVCNIGYCQGRKAQVLAYAEPFRIECEANTVIEATYQVLCKLAEKGILNNITLWRSAKR
ncbi:hypothetical protein EZS27_009368 [termite gut metagenome]|uniref:Uncharacterized protein n=1 Tax=termite gut metagenome TaxID=433724 RepID=A0A5J4SAI1_9ZZZZ